MTDSNDLKPTFSLTLIEKSVGILIMIITGWTAFQSSTVKDTIALQGSSIESLKAEIAKSANERETRKLNHEITIKIFEEVSNIYKTPNQTPDILLNRLFAVAALIEAVPDIEVRKSLASAVKAAADNASATVIKPTDAVILKTEAVKNKVDLTIFRADQNDSESSRLRDEKSLSVAAQSSNINDPKWSNYDFDFFWCETADNPEAAKNAAESAFNLKNLDQSATGRWRVRKLPAEINIKPGYRKEGYLINVSSDDEQKIANVLSSLLKQQEIPSKDFNFVIKKVSNSTPWYISVFMCPSALNEH